MKVIKAFYCIQEKKTYKVGDEYTSKRKDIKEYLEQTKQKAKSKK